MGCVSGKDQHKTTQKVKHTTNIKEQEAAQKYRESELQFQSKDDPRRICSLTHISNDDHKNPSSVPRQFNSHKQLCTGSAYSAYGGAITQPTFTKTTGTYLPHSAHRSNQDLILKNSQHPASLEYVLARKSFVESQHIPFEQRLSMFPAPRLQSVDRSTLIFRRRIESQGQ